ncbi:MAG: alpha/beta hydrolase fold domain-containing protein [Streptosporangiales bacterium]|nr:alpha/beta hydrolase fold domain-containing protein [Streptosporangiales bacterium]
MKRCAGGDVPEMMDLDAVRRRGGRVKRRRWRSARAILLAAGAAATLLAFPGPALADGVHEATFLYGRDGRQMLDAFWRSSARPLPGVVVVHGGYWVAGDKGSWDYNARWLRDNGFQVFSINYRLAGQARWPAQRDDALHAITWLKRNAGRFNLDPARITIMGASAGGHIAAAVGTHGTGGRTVRGVVALSPPVAPILGYQEGLQIGALDTRAKLTDTTLLLAGCAPMSQVPGCADTWRDMSADTEASRGDAPMLLMHSAGDFVDSAGSFVLGDALRKQGVPVTVEVLPGSKHAAALISGAAERERVLGWLKAAVGEPPRRAPAPGGRPLPQIPGLLDDDGYTAARPTA